VHPIGFSDDGQALARATGLPERDGGMAEQPDARDPEGKPIGYTWSYLAFRGGHLVPTLAANNRVLISLVITGHTSQCVGALTCARASQGFVGELGMTEQLENKFELSSMVLRSLEQRQAAEAASAGDLAPSTPRAASLRATHERVIRRAT
jgi:hypothetical protein